jgi:ATP-dependent DNA helicase PIF1
MNNSQPFGGKVIVFLGDFKQLMPVEPGRRYPATVKDCSWWTQCQVLRFTKNWRAVQHPEFCDLLEQVGNGQLQQVAVPATSKVSCLSDLIARVYGNDMTTVSNSRHLIMAFTLQTCNDVNAACMAALPGEPFLSSAFDDTKDNRQPDLYNDDYLASLSLHGVPPSLLSLKVGARYMITKNYNPSVGACNGTMCELQQVSRNTCHVKIQSGCHTGRVICLPRCSCHVSRENSGLPFEFTRVQFPLIPAYCVSVHKSQGQSLAKIGLIVDQESFAHGQVYTALSRTSSWLNITVMLPNDISHVTNKVHQHFL